ncbi:hypothetical protein CKO25_04650 [Thiocapsa imhoffii]|uniref:Uncharacterized protein n=1 Tax=Thiocapsa imhoffii TaxID=382777 RepID=A0A9X0WG30_9GAMM|nr:hypothetical protein [Thiocapsa imhoffii]MBK1643958.1 hypothetical protein [Thiocapsa imhoffii]
MERDYKLPSLYKSLLILALVFGPFFWLAFTEDGQRRTDLALMFILGKPEFNAALETMSTALTEAQFRETFPNLALQCADGRNPFGNRLCAAPIGSFNGIPSASVAFFFAQDRLQAVKLSYRRAYHTVIRDWVERRVTSRRDPRALQQPIVQVDDGVASWEVSDGVLVLRDGPLANHEEPALFWLARAPHAP